MANNRTCKDCAERMLGCHDDCERYQKWKKAHDQCMKQLREDAVADFLYFSREGKKNRRKFHLGR